VFVSKSGTEDRDAGSGGGLEFVDQGCEYLRRSTFGDVEPLRNLTERLRLRVGQNISLEGGELMIRCRFKNLANRLFRIADKIVVPKERA